MKNDPQCVEGWASMAGGGLYIHIVCGLTKSARGEVKQHSSKERYESNYLVAQAAI